MGDWVFGGLVVLAVAGLAAALVLSAVRRTVTRQEAGLPLPACPPAGPALLAEQARYLGTTFAPSTVRRFNGYGLLGRGVVGLALDEGGLRVERDRDPCASRRRPARGRGRLHHAGKEVYADKVLVVDWRLGPATLRSGFALDEQTAPAWAARLAPLVPR